MHRFATILATASATALLATNPALAFDLSAMTPAERSAFQAEVRDYLLANPEVLVEALDVLEQRQAQAQSEADSAMVRDNAPDLFSDGRSWTGGNQSGDITLVEFVDYNCGYCKKAHAEVAELVGSDGNIRYMLKEYPILGEPSLLASRFAIAVRMTGGPDAYKAAHDRLMTFRGDITPDALAQLADTLGLDGARVMATATSDAVTAEIAANHALGERLAINGTPAFVLQDGKARKADTMLRGYVPLAAMQGMIRDIRAE